MALNYTSGARSGPFDAAPGAPAPAARDEVSGWPAAAVGAPNCTVGPGIVTRSYGGLADVRALTPADISPEELGWALSGVNRWGARARKMRRHYPVSAHCRHVASIAKHLHPEAGPWLELACLLHDGPEAYLGDPPSPLGAMPEFAGVKSLLAAAEPVFERAYGLPRGALHHDWVREADRLAACVEAHRLCEGAEAWATPLADLGLPAYLLSLPPFARDAVREAADYADELRGAYAEMAGLAWRPGGAP